MSNWIEGGKGNMTALMKQEKVKKILCHMCKYGDGCSECEFFNPEDTTYDEFFCSIRDSMKLVPFDDGWDITSAMVSDCYEHPSVREMSNDLINRKEVIKILDECGYVNCHDGKDFEANSRVDKCRQRVLDLPRAYDVDKVCRKINESNDMDNLIDVDHAIKVVKTGECSEWLEAVADELESSAKSKWIPAEEPPKDNKYILMSFENFSVPQVGRYEEDEKGGAFYMGDSERRCVCIDLIVNAWMPLPKAYRADEEEILEYGQSNEKAGSVSRNAKTAADIDQAIEYFEDEISQMDVFSDIVHFQEKERKNMETALWALQKVQETIQGQQDGSSQCATSHG